MASSHFGPAPVPAHVLDPSSETSDLDPTSETADSHGDRVRVFTCRPPRHDHVSRHPALGAVLIDRHSSLLRAVCARSVVPGPPFDRIRHSLDGLRDAGARVAVTSHNRSQGWKEFDQAEMRAMQARIEAAIGEIDLWCACLIGPDGRCACESTAHGALATAADAVGVDVAEWVVVTEGDRLATAAALSGASDLLAGWTSGHAGDGGGGPRPPAPPGPAARASSETNRWELVAQALEARARSTNNPARPDVV